MDSMREMTFAELIRDGVLEIGDGYRAKNDELGGDSGPLFLRAGLLTSGGFAWHEAEHFNKDSRSKLASKMGVVGDTVITTKGNSVGRSGFVPPTAPEFVYSPHLSYWRSRDHSRLSPGFIRYWAQSVQFKEQLRALAHGTDMAPYLSLADQQRLRITLPVTSLQAGIAQVLGALDDKIAVNEGMAATSRELGQNLLRQATHADESREVRLDEITSLITRGVAPKYSEDETALTVLNQRCIRDGRVDTALARRTVPSKTSSTKLLRRHDVLVNSTGVGTLGRVAIWQSDAAATSDSHVSIVRFNSSVDPVCAGFAMMEAEPEIEALGEGSTGQTELSRLVLGAQSIRLPSPGKSAGLRPKLDSLEERGSAALSECVQLAALRDTLLPKLMSGEIRIKDAEKIVGEAT